MAFSFSKLFSKDKTPSKQEETAQKATHNEANSVEIVESKAKKHGEDGVCCGSCS